MSNTYVFNGFGYEGDNQSPAIAWSGAPADTKVSPSPLYDPDAPTGSGWWHWLAFNSPVTTLSLPAGAGAADSKVLP